MTTGPAIMTALMAPAGQADPYPLYAQARQLGPASAIGDGWFLVTGYAAVSQVLRDPGFGLPDPRPDGRGSLIQDAGGRSHRPETGRVTHVWSLPCHSGEESFAHEEFTVFLPACSVPGRPRR